MIGFQNFPLKFSRIKQHLDDQKCCYPHMHVLYSLSGKCERAFHYLDKHWRGRMHTTTRPIATTFQGHGCISDITNGHDVDSQATWVIDELGLFFDMLSMCVCTAKHWQTSGRLVPEIDVCTACVQVVTNNCKELSQNSYYLSVIISDCQMG